MIKKFPIFITLIKHYGLINALVYVLYKLFPGMFKLLHAQVSAGNNIAWPGMAEIDTQYSMDATFDYKSWVDFGGAKVAPVKTRDKNKATTIIWFVPDWTNVWGGGHFTLFRFADHFSKSNTRNIIYTYDNKRWVSPTHLENELRGALPGSNLQVFVDPKLLPPCDAAIATTWQSAYHVRAFNLARKKFYFMQDYESHFYAHGTASMQANATYTFGFIGITGGKWLRSIYESYGGKAQNYMFAADKSIFYPENKSGKVRAKVKKLFFYGRPSTERRCFELGLVVLKKISEKYPNVEIVIAGLDLKHPPPFKATLLGNMTLKQTGVLYRTCDIGMAFSGTNLSYLPVELMTSGVPVISNNGPHVEWHCKHKVNSYLADPVPAAIFEAFEALYKDQRLRQKIVNGGLQTMKSLTWQNQMTKIFSYVKKNI